MGLEEPSRRKDQEVVVDEEEENTPGGCNVSGECQAQKTGSVFLTGPRWERDASCLLSLSLSLSSSREPAGSHMPPNLSGLLSRASGTRI